MRKFLLATVSILAFGAAHAADLALKAPQNPFLTPTGSGWYIGIGAEAAVAQANVSGTNLFATSLVGGNLTAAGGAIGGDVGYLTTINSWRLRFEASAMYSNIQGSGGSVVGAGNTSIVSRWSATQEVDIDFALFKTLNTVIGSAINFPTFSPVLPSNIAVAAAPWQYVGVGAREAGLDGNFFGATGSDWSAAPMIKSGFLWQTLDASGKPNGGALDAYAYVAFPQRGITLNNVFGRNGAPMIGGGADMGTQYGLGLKWDLGI